MTNFTNTQRDAAVNVIKAAVSAGKADATLSDRAAKLVEAGITAKDISKDGAHLSAFQSLTAETSLTAKQFATWSDTSLAQGVTVDGKRVDTERGKLVKRVNSVVARIRAKLKEPATRGTRTTKTPTQKFFAMLDEYVERFGKDGASDAFEFDPTVARAAFVKLIKELK